MDHRKRRKLYQHFWGGGGASYEGPLDLVPGAVVAYSAARALSAAWIGQELFTLRRASDNATLAFAAEANGSLDIAAVIAWAAGDAFGEEWNDQSGGGFDVYQTDDPGLQPQWIANAGNSLPAFSFVRASSQYMYTEPPCPVFANGAVSFIAVIGNVTQGSTQGIFGTNGDAGDYNTVGFLNTNKPVLDMLDGANEAGGRFAVTALSGIQILDGVWEFGSRSLRLNGTALTLDVSFDAGGAVASIPSLPNDSNFSVGSSDNIGNWDGYIIELICYGTVLPDAVRQNIATYYGITL